jgi:hypothetical protein
VLVHVFLAMSHPPGGLLPSHKYANLLTIHAERNSVNKSWRTRILEKACLETFFVYNCHRWLFLHLVEARSSQSSASTRDFVTEKQRFEFGKAKKSWLMHKKVTYRVISGKRISNRFSFECCFWACWSLMISLIETRCFRRAMKKP